MKKSLLIFKVLPLITAFSALLLPARAQVIQEVQNSFNLYKQSALQEKLFVQTDKTTYLPGEIIWFKIYCVDGNDHKPLNLSKVVYVDILGDNQNAVVQTKVAIKNGVGDGSIYVPVTVSNGNYKFRAYTNWMKNFSPDFYFEKTVTFINPLKSPESPVKPADLAYDIQFFPEGGNLVSGIESKVAFKAINQYGKGVDLKGAIVDQRNDTIVKFQSLKFGMGSFLLTPASDNTYKAVIKIGNGAPIIKNIPVVNSQGYVMKLKDNGSGQIQVAVSGANTAGENIYLFAHTRQIVKYAETAILSNGTASFTIDKNVLGDGISHITIFNSAKQPVCERLYFKRPAQQLVIEASANQSQYDLRTKVNVNVSAKDKTGKSLDAEMSMAVYKVDSLQNIDQSEIFSYLWLNSELKGNIESAAYYLKNANAETDEAIDNLMLTQGWRRFQWSTVLENKPADFNFLPEYFGHIISAKIVNSETNKPAKDVVTYLGIPGRRVQLYTAISDSLGRINYFTRDFFGANEIIAQTNQLVDSIYRIDILTPFSEQYTKNGLPKFSFTDGMITALKSHSLGVQVSNIYSGKYLKRYYDPIIDTSAYYGKPSAVYKLDDFTRFTTMEEDLREYVKEDNIINTRGKFHIKVLNTDRGFLDGEDPLVMVDGIPVFNLNKVFAVDPLKVKKLEVVSQRYYYGATEQNGIFSFTTYKGDLGGVELDPRAIVVDYEGLQLQREFYSPVYDSQAQAASRIPDYRNLLYWTPTVTGQGNGTVSFYTSDLQGKYIGVIQGITANGDAASQYFTFEVK
ncbi:MG2 domain-containing protein [Mucilaginibacter sp. X4EP1]|uniref:MG2 domain-containing protein n=1 Tax=Mucilaginibacter sp. X4EP1 TaxID=2723092 RepID=UPI0021694BE8|nr:hypothetical protein [Mucilaginibacter sp. X4EP1]MCS3813965.1 hypothetical protein [Mucilaginibacter sp. X4EP1]